MSSSAPREGGRGVSVSQPDTRTDERLSAIRTFLIADVRGYTPFTKQHGDEAAARLAVKFEQVAREGMSALRGEVIETRGDEVLATFSSARQALRAAVELQDALAHETAYEPALPLHVGMGLAAGEAVRVGDGYRGGAINLAARLCSQAQAGEVLASDQLVALAGTLAGITFEPRGPVQLKGLETPVDVIRVATAHVEPIAVEPGELAGPRREFPPELDSATPIVGRERELLRLRWFWRRARHGHSRAVFLCGSSGIGKTRLASELAREANAQGGDVVYAACAGPAQLAIDELRQVEALRRPVLVVADDVDIAGGTLLDVVGGLVTDPERPLLLLCTYQDESSPLVASLVGRTDPAAETRINLRPLGRAQVHEIAALYAGQTVEGMSLDELVEQSGGVPALVHRAAADWAGERASERLSESASRTAADRSGLRAAEAELAESVIDLQHARERRRLYAEEQPEAVVCPFKGLAKFELADADYFFGRERVVAELVARLVGASFLGVVGPSGSGKSSLVHAGLLPALGAGIIPGSERWPQVLMRPGEHPLDELERALEVKELTGELMAKASSPRGPGETERIVLVVDQFEELFTACRSEAEREQFVQRLISSEADLVVVVALRADFYGRCTDYPELAELLGANQVPVGPMQEDEIRRAIELPARRAGLVIEPELVDALVADVEGEPGGLPLLSTALLELWQRRRGRTLTLEAYEETGGVRGAVARLAEDAYRRLTPEQQVLARAMLMRLAGPGPGETVVRRRVALADLDVERNEDSGRVLTVLTDARLLTTSEGTLEVAHEALLAEWPRLRSWLEEDSEGRRLYQHMIESAKEWEERGRDEADLYRGARLAAVLDRAADPGELNERERHFLAESRRHSERELERQRRANRRLRILLAALAGLLLAAIAAGAFALELRGRAQESARAAAARELAGAALANLDDDPERSTLLALEAAEKTMRPDGAIVPEAEDALYRALGIEPVRTVLGAGNAVALAPDGQTFVAGSARGATLWNAETGEQVRGLDGAGDVRAVEYSPDGKLIATGNAAGTVTLWDAETARAVRELDHDGAIVSIEFSSESEQLVTVAQDRLVRVWEVRTGHAEGRVRAWTHAATRPPSGSDLAALTWDARLVVANLDARPAGLVARVFDLSETVRPPSLDFLIEDPSPRDVDVSPEGTLAAAVSGGNLILWRLPSAAPLGDLKPARASNVEFAPTGPRLATGGLDGKAKLWTRTPTGVRLVVASAAGQAPVMTVSFSGDGTRLLTGSRDGSARVYDLSTAHLLDAARRSVTRSLTLDECRQYLHADSCPRR